MNPNTLDSVFNALVGLIPGQEVKPVTLPPLTGPGKTQPIPKTFPGQAGAGIFSVPQPNATDSEGKPAYKIPSWDGTGWSLDQIKQWWDSFGQVTVKGIGWNILITLFLLIAFFVILTGESDPVAIKDRLSPI